MISKEAILLAVEEVLNKKWSELKAAFNDVEASLKNDSKSTAGDKHETSRAMAHLEQEKLSGQLSILENQTKLLEQLKKQSSDSVIITDKGIFFTGLPLGKVKAGDQYVHCISLTSPLGNLLSKANAGDVVTMNGVQYKITQRL